MPAMGLAKFRQKGKAVGMASTRSNAARLAAKTRLYDKQAAALVTMLADRGTESCMGSLDNIMKQLQTQDRFAFSQMLNKVMSGAMKIKNTATIAQVDREREEMRRSNDSPSNARSPSPKQSQEQAQRKAAKMSKAEEKAQAEWTSVMKWAKRRALENTDSDATLHILMHKVPDELTALRLESMALAALKGRGAAAPKVALAQKYWEGLASGAVGNLFKGAQNASIFCEPIVFFTKYAIILPRQARDRLDVGKSAQKEMRFPASGAAGLVSFEHESVSSVSV
jgi:hypothetical protein